MIETPMRALPLRLWGVPCDDLGRDLPCMPRLPMAWQLREYSGRLVVIEQVRWIYDDIQEGFCVGLNLYGGEESPKRLFRADFPEPIHFYRDDTLTILAGDMEVEVPSTWDYRFAAEIMGQLAAWQESREAASRC